MEKLDFGNRDEGARVRIIRTADAAANRKEFDEAIAQIMPILNGTNLRSFVLIVSENVPGKPGVKRFGTFGLGNNAEQVHMVGETLRAMVSDEVTSQMIGQAAIAEASEKARP